MRKSMNLKAMLEGRPLSEGVALGDEVTVGRDDEEKRKGVVKVPNGPGDTAGVLIDGQLEMVPNDEITRQKTTESEDRADMEDVDNFGYTRAQRIKQFTVTGWSPHECYRVKPGTGSNWLVKAPNGSTQDVCASKSEAMRYANGRNLHAKWAFDGGHGSTIPDSKITFGELAEGFDHDDDDDGIEYDNSKAKAQERAKARADYADDFGDEASDDYMREQLEEGIMGMSMMPSFARMQALAGIRVTESENPFAKKDDEEASDEPKDDQAEEEQADDTVEADTEEQADSEEQADDQVEVAVAAPDAFGAETDAIEDEAEAVEDQADAIDDQTASIEIEVDAEPELAANHPATSGEVTMMSAPAPVEDFPEAEEAAPEPESLAVCTKALGDLEQHLQNVSVKDFAAISKRLQSIQNSLFEGFTGRRAKR